MEQPCGKDVHEGYRVAGDELNGSIAVAAAVIIRGFIHGDSSHPQACELRGQTAATRVFAEYGRNPRLLAIPVAATKPRNPPPYYIIILRF
jgi:hypothetical protein